MTTLEQFIKTVERGPGYREITYDVKLLKGLSKEKQGEAVSFLLNRIHQQQDATAVETLAAVGATSVLDELEQYTNHQNPFLRSAVNRALLRLRGGQDAVQAVATDVKTSPPVVDILNINALAREPGAAAFEGILTGLDAPFLPTRYSALNVFNERFDLESLYTPEPSLYWTTISYAMREFPSVAAMGARDLKMFYRALEGGATPDSLELSYTPDQPDVVADFLTSWRAKEGPMEIALVRKLRGQERRWAEAILVTSLNFQEVRAAQAIGDLALDHFAVVLKEARELFEKNTELVTAIDEALARLTSPA